MHSDGDVAEIGDMGVVTEPKSTSSFRSSTSCRSLCRAPPSRLSLRNLLEAFLALGHFSARAPACLHQTVPSGPEENATFGAELDS
jgi:hypothetical protein